jgi:hypothetical protein
MQLLDYDESTGMLTLYLIYEEYSRIESIFSSVLSLYSYQLPEALGVDKNGIELLHARLFSVITQSLLKSGIENEYTKKLTPENTMPLLERNYGEAGYPSDLTIMMRAKDLRNILSVLRGVYNTYDRQDPTDLESSQKEVLELAEAIAVVEAELTARSG